MRDSYIDRCYLSVDGEDDFIFEFVDIARNTDKVVATLCNYEQVDAIANELLLGDGIDFTFVKKYIHEDEAKDLDFFVSVDPDGGVIVQPIEWFNDKYFNEIELAFIMDEDFDKCTLNYLYNNDIEVVFVDCSGRNIPCEYCSNLNHYDEWDEWNECNECSYSEHYKCDECKYDEENDGSYSDYNDVTVTRAKDGTPIGFSIHWGNTGENSSKHSSYSFFSDDLDELKSVAKDMEVYL